MPTKTYSIKWIIDDRAAQAAFKRGVQGLADLDRAALKAANSMEAAFVRAGAAVDGLNARTAAASQGFASAGSAASRAAEGMARDFNRAGAAAEASAARFGSAWAASTEAAAKSLPALVAPMARLQLESARFGDAFSAAMARGKLTADQAIPAARFQITRTRQEAVSLGTDLVAAGRGGAAALEMINGPLVRTQTESVILEEKLGGVTKATGKTEKAMGGLLAGMLALGAAEKIFDTIMSESEALEKYWKGLAENAGAFRDSLRELASLKGQPGPNDTVTADVLSLANRTGMTPAKAAEFSGAYENLGPTVREKHHYMPTAGTPDKLETDVVAETGRTARRLGVDEKAAGEAIGTVGLFHTLTSVEQAMEQFGTALKGLSEGKLKYGPGVSALNKGMAKLLDPSEAATEGAKAGRVGSYGEGGVYLGTLSLGTGTAEQASHRMVQNSRVLNPDADNTEGIKALKAAGLKDEMSDPEKLIQLNKYLKAQKVASPRDWLSKNNLGTVATREGMEASLKVADVLEERLNRARESEKTGAAGKALVADNAKYMATDRSATAAAAASKRDVIEKVAGISGPEELEKAKAVADTKFMAADPGGWASLTRTVTNKLLSPLTWLERGVSGEDLEKEGHRKYGAIPTLEREAERVGLDLKPFREGLDAGDYPTRAHAFTVAADAVRAGGGDPLRMDDLDALTRAKIDSIRPAPAPPALLPPMPGPGGLPSVFPESPRGGGPPLTSGAVAPMGIRDFMAATTIGSLPGAGPGTDIKPVMERLAAALEKSNKLADEELALRRRLETPRTPPPLPE